MRKILYIYFCSLFFVGCTEDFDSKESEKRADSKVLSNTSKLPPQEQPCPEGTHPVKSYDFDALRLHRKSTGCQSRFSICSDGEWVTTCVDNNYGLSKYNVATNKVLVSAVLINNQENLELHFPIELKSAPTFKAEDFETFGFDEDYKISEGIVIKAGDYEPKFTVNEIIVIVDLR